MSGRKEQCRALYRQAFPEPDFDFEDRLFRFGFSYCRTLSVGGTVLSMLFALPCRTETEKGTQKAYYIYAAATEEAHRGQGYMKRLIRRLQRDTNRILFLKPACEELFGFYRALGFSECLLSPAHSSRGRILPEQGFAKLAEGEQIPCCPKPCRVMVYPPGTELDALYFPYCMES